MKYKQAYDGDWVKPNPQKGYKIVCCDCGLVHIINFRVVKGKVQFQPFRDNRATGQIRRHKKNAKD